MKIKSIASACIICTMLTGVFVGCSSNDSAGSGGGNTSGGGLTNDINRIFDGGGTDGAGNSIGNGYGYGMDGAENITGNYGGYGTGGMSGYGYGAGTGTGGMSGYGYGAGTGTGGYSGAGAYGSGVLGGSGITDYEANTTTNGSGNGQ